MRKIFIIIVIIFSLNTLVNNYNIYKINQDISHNSSASGVSKDLRRSFFMGFTPWPWDNTWEALTSTYDYINNNSDIISMHLEEGVPWKEAYNNIEFSSNMMEGWQLRRQLTGKNLKIFLSISPLNQLRNGLSNNRSESIQSEIPQMFKNRKFNDPIIKKAYLNYAIRAVEYFKPQYMAISIEANELLDNSPNDWEDYSELYISTYTELKSKYPNIKIFFTTSLHNLTNNKSGITDYKFSKMKELWEYSDLIGFSYYPYLEYPMDYSNPLKSLFIVKKYSNKPIAITETGYPAEMNSMNKNLAPVSDEIQKLMYAELFRIAREENFVFVILWDYRDYDKLWEKIKNNVPDWAELWKDNGLFDENGNPRPSKQIWDMFFALVKN